MKPEITEREFRKIDEQAALWMLRKEEGPLSCGARRRYEAWLKLPHREEALRNVETLSGRLKQPWRRRRLAMRTDPWSKTPVAANS